MGNGFWGTGYGEREDRTSYAPSPVTQNLSPVTLLLPSGGASAGRQRIFPTGPAQRPAAGANVPPHEETKSGAAERSAAPTRRR